MSFSSKLTLFGLVASSSLFFAGPASAELAKWDQTRVTEIAQQLAKACEAWWMALQAQPGGQFESGNMVDEFGLVQKAQALHEQSQVLAGHLAEGTGPGETLDMYEALKEIADDTEVQAREAELDQPTLDAWAKVADLMRQIAPYYDADGERE